MLPCRPTASCRICCRCGSEYLVSASGRCVREEECYYHWGRLRRNRGEPSLQTPHPTTSPPTPGQAEAVPLHQHWSVFFLRVLSLPEPCPSVDGGEAPHNPQPPRTLAPTLSTPRGVLPLAGRLLPTGGCARVPPHPQDTCVLAATPGEGPSSGVPNPHSLRGPGAPQERRRGGCRCPPHRGHPSSAEKPLPQHIRCHDCAREAWDWAAGGRALTSSSLSVAGGWETQYTCCSAAIGSTGCQVAKVGLWGPAPPPGEHPRPGWKRGAAWARAHIPLSCPLIRVPLTVALGTVGRPPETTRPPPASLTGLHRSARSNTCRTAGRKTSKAL